MIEEVKRVKTLFIYRTLQDFVLYQMWKERGPVSPSVGLPLFDALRDRNIQQTKYFVS